MNLSTMKLEYFDFFLEPKNDGLTPIDNLYGLISRVENESPRQISIEGFPLTSTHTILIHKCHENQV